MHFSKLHQKSPFCYQTHSKSYLLHNPNKYVKAFNYTQEHNIKHRNQGSQISTFIDLTSTTKHAVVDDNDSSESIDTSKNSNSSKTSDSEDDSGDDDGGQTETEDGTKE